MDIVTNGPRNDIEARVDIEEENFKYYIKQKPLEQFVALGIEPLLPLLPNNIRMADFGGGSGVLTNYISNYFLSKGIGCQSVVIDANPIALAKAKKLGLRTLQLCFDAICPNEKYDIVIMRGVNHYNSSSAQFSIYKNTLECLSAGGYFVSSICSGSLESCALKSAIANISELGRAYEKDQIHATSVEEYINMLRATGFKQIEVVGACDSEYWCIKKLWRRSNQFKLDSSKSTENLFYDKAEKILDEYLKKTYPGSMLRQLLDLDGKQMYIPKTLYPVIVAKK